MVWPSLATRIDKMPTVLAGPILRAVTETSVTVWLAFKEPVTVTLTIHATDVALAPTIGNAGTAVATKLGPKLYVVAVTAQLGSASLSHGTLYFYRLSFATQDGTKDLVQATGANDITAFAYGTHKLPSFLLPPNDLEQVRFALGSCRKMHAASGDMLALLDDLISANVDSPAARPQLLMLGGDQIYADEVSDTLLMMLTDAGKVLLGPEELPLDGGTTTTPEQCLPSTRTKMIKAGGFTSVDTRSHLMGLGEYLAMYLFAWSDVLWIDPDTNLPVVPSFQDLATSLTTEQAVAIKDLQLEIIKQRTHTLVAYVTMSRVRRALANIATYMILDDHEITDDLHLSRQFCEGVYGSELGRRVVQNAMIAYALCQHWGNVPDQFTGTAPGATLLSKFANATTDYRTLAKDGDLARIVGVHTATQLAAPPLPSQPFGVYHDADSLVYNYTIEGAAFQLIVTDTRTWRTFPRGGKVSAPDLLPESQIAAQVTATPPLGDRLLMVLVTTNMPNCPSIRQAARDLPGLPTHAFDFEDFFDAWSIEQIDCARMIVAMAKKASTSTGAMKNRVVLLTGDVHSSQATRLGYFASQQAGDPAGAPTSAQVVFAQIVASAVHNLSDATLGEHTDGYDYVPGWKEKLVAQKVERTEGFVGWNPVTMPKGRKVGTRMLRMSPPSNPMNGTQEDVRFNPDRPNQTTREERQTRLSIKLPIQLVETPHYRYRLDYLHRSESGFVNSVAPRGTTPLADRAAASQIYMTYAIYGGYEQIGTSNLGDLTFAKGTGHPDLIAKFTARWADWSDVSSMRWSRFDVSLDPIDPMYPRLPDP